jgi:hypothetical protein
VNLVDPSGKNSCVPGMSGSCGPDLTDWLMEEIKRHVAYGKEIKALYDDIWWQMMTPSFKAVGKKLKDINTRDPFKTIIDERIVDRLLESQEIGQGTQGIQSVWLLRLVEYGMYGLAVNYSDAKYYNFPREGDIGSCGYGCPVGRTDRHRTVTLCGRCIDQTDIGNLMFGVGGAARGFSHFSTSMWAQLYNLSADGYSFAAFNEDPRAASAGWTIANANYFYNRKVFCETLEKANGRLGGIHEDAQNALRCPACKTEHLIASQGHKTFSSLEKIFGDEGSTVTWFINLFNIN